MMDVSLPRPASPCPICNAVDAYVDRIGVADEYYVECVNCKVYRASRRTFRHFEYLRWRQDPDGLIRLAKLAAVLGDPLRVGAIRLEYETWAELIREPGIPNA